MPEEFGEPNEFDREQAELIWIKIQDSADETARMAFRPAFDQVVKYINERRAEHVALVTGVPGYGALCEKLRELMPGFQPEEFRKRIEYGIARALSFEVRCLCQGICDAYPPPPPFGQSDQAAAPDAG